MATCKTVTVSGPSIEAPTVQDFNIETGVNSATVTVTWRNNNDATIGFDSVLTVGGNETRQSAGMSAGGTDTVTYDVSFDIPQNEQRSKEFCVNAESVSGA